MLRLFGQITPTLPERANSASGFSRKRAADTSTLPSAGSSAPSATWTKISSVIFPPLTSGIDALPEWLEAKPLHRVDEQFIRTGAQREIGLDDVLDDIRDLFELHRWPDQGAEFGFLVSAATDCDLVDFLAVL